MRTQHSTYGVSGKICLTASVTTVLIGVGIAAVVGSTRTINAQTVPDMIPAAWHQPLSQQEIALTSRVIAALKRAPNYPRVTKYQPLLGAPPQKQLNAWEQDMEITVPVEMFRFVERDPPMLEFLIAHEAGHAKQQEIYGQNCYTATNVEMSKCDWFRALGDVVGGAVTGGTDGALRATAILQKQACEDNADAWAVQFMREAGLDATGGIRLFTKFAELANRSGGWRYFTQQFTSNHSISELRIAHIAALIAQR